MDTSRNAGPSTSLDQSPSSQRDTLTSHMDTKTPYVKYGKFSTQVYSASPTPIFQGIPDFAHPSFQRSSYGVAVPHSLDYISTQGTEIFSSPAAAETQLPEQSWSWYQTHPSDVQGNSSSQDLPASRSSMFPIDNFQQRTLPMYTPRQSSTAAPCTPCSCSCHSTTRTCCTVVPGMTSATSREAMNASVQCSFGNAGSCGNRGQTVPDNSPHSRMTLQQSNFQQPGEYLCMCFLRLLPN